MQLHSGKPYLVQKHSCPSCRVQLDFPQRQIGHKTHVFRSVSVGAAELTHFGSLLRRTTVGVVDHPSTLLQGSRKVGHGHDRWTRYESHTRKSPAGTLAATGLYLWQQLT